jgi:hypothetical protein
MLSIRGRGVVAALSGLFLFAACSDSSSPAGGDEATITQDVAAYVADLTADDIVLMTTFADPLLGAGPFAAPPFDGNVSYTREVTFFDEFGDPMDAFHRLLTESVNIVVALEGSRSRTGQRGTMSMTVSRNRDMTVSGLLDEETERTWNGTGSSDVNRVRQSDEFGDRTYDMSSSTTVTDVVVPVPRNSGWPISGTIHREITVQVVSGLEDPRTRERIVDVVFNGTHLVDITINGELCQLDLEIREVTCPSG